MVSFQGYPAGRRAVSNESDSTSGPCRYRINLEDLIKCAFYLKERRNLVLNPWQDSANICLIRNAAVTTPMQSDTVVLPIVQRMHRYNGVFIRAATAVLRRAGFIPNG
jgi:hypothetical protein